MIIRDKGNYQITESGKSELEDCRNKNIKLIDKERLKKHKPYRDFLLEKCTIKKTDNSTDSFDNSKELSPEENMESIYSEVKQQLKDDIIEKICKSHHSFFEYLVIDLLINIGYGGSKKEAGKSFQKTKDEGIDGIIYEDKLGLDLIHVQAKRWENTVGRPEIQKFAGALQGKRTKKGIFITTSSFSREAREYVKKIRF